jgi:inosine/guanosine/xanthosine phosphorylase family protein
MHLRGQVEHAAESLKSQLPGLEAPVAFFQLGSGFKIEGLLDREQARVPFEALEGMPADASAAGHCLELVLGYAGERQVLVALGRRHLYEGLGAMPCVLPVCAAVFSGIRRVVLLAACGSVNSEFRPGSVVAFTDYINNQGTSPLVGPLPLGESYFVEMGEPFSNAMISEFVNAAADQDLDVRLGVYQANLGPQFETPAEVDMARKNGADLVGMSTVPETIAARALGAEVMGLGLVTNMGTSNDGGVISHADVTEISAGRSSIIMKSLKRWIREV